LNVPAVRWNSCDEPETQSTALRDQLKAILEEALLR
jgi:hypothetical protein